MRALFHIPTIPSDDIDLLVAGTGLTALVLSLWGVRLAQFFSVRMPQRVARPPGDIFPSVAIILPLKGVEPDTGGNIEALCRQNYPSYRVIFAVESADDPVVALLNQAAPTLGCPVRTVIAGPAATRGQKVHNQLAAIDATTDQDAVLAFMDADACPGDNWLAALVHPLTYGPWVGATTGYRFYVPAEPSAANAVLSVANAGVLILLGPFRRTLAWGGSMAIRRADFFGYGVHAAWQSALSDDYVLTWCVKKNARKQIHFVPQCIVPSVSHHTFGTLFEFAARQYRITRICSPSVWAAALFGPVAYLLGWLLPLALAVAGMVGGRPDLVPFALFPVAIYLAGCWRGYFLLRAARRLLPAQWPVIRSRWRWFTIYYPAVQAFTLICVAASAVGRRVAWRGITYTMLDRLRTRVEARP